MVVNRDVFQNYEIGIEGKRDIFYVSEVAVCYFVIDLSIENRRSKSM